jgi:hydrogenase large subunit
LTIASFYKDWGAIGGFHNFMAFGDFPMEGYGNKDMSTFKIPAGVILIKIYLKYMCRFRRFKTVEEYVNNSWYDYEGDPKGGKQPWSGETKINYTGPKPPYEFLDVNQKYSYIKTPRWKGQAMEVGPLQECL